MSEQISRKQNALLAKKKTLLNEIKYYEFKIKQESSTSHNNNLICDDSSDSECEFTMEVGLSVTELKLKQRSLKTCLQATQELTGVTILQSEVNILVQDPVLESHRPVTEEGVWHEVTAECRIDLVPFSINYFVHKPSRMFGPMSYRNLQVTPVKSSHEVELAMSVLNTVRQPSDAIEIIRNYSAAHRSRRTTLARLAEKYGEALFMVPMAEGGYKLKCADLMEVQWSLQNKWSPLAPFHHRMVFDLEFMDESYIKTISTLHKQIIDPTIDTDDRTLLLAKIINTCLEAKADITQNQESTESESEAAEKLRRRRTTLDQEPQEPERNRKKDSEVMAPPKSLPKKTKPKGKENTTDNKTKAAKRTADGTSDKENAKKPKTTAIDKVTDTINTENKTKSTKTKPDKVNKGNNLENGVEINDVIRNSNSNSKNSENVIKRDKNKHSDAAKGKIEINNIKESNKPEKNKKTIKVNKQQQAQKSSGKIYSNVEIESLLVNEDKNKHSDTANDQPVTKDEIEINYIKESKQSEKSKKTVKESKKQQTQKSNDRIKSNVETESLLVNKDLKKERKNPEQKVESNKERKLSANVTKKTKQKDITESSKSENPKIAEDKTHKTRAPETLTKKNVEKSNKETTNKTKSVPASKTNKEVLLTKLPNLVKNSKDSSKKPAVGNYLKNSFLPKALNKLKTTLPTKIPRISPRKLSNIKSGIQDISKDSRTSQKSLQKTTYIPRLLKKPQIFEANKV